MDRLTDMHNGNGRLLRGVEVWGAITRLAEYENLEEQGLLVRLPCKEGSDVYCVIDGAVPHIEKHTMSSIFALCMICGNKMLWLSDFGKTVFTTLEEAENKLKLLKEK